MPKAVYTAICGKYDRLRPVPERFIRGWEAYCFADEDIAPAAGWKMVRVREYNLPPEGLSKKIKILTRDYLPGKNLTLWIDASLAITGPLDEYLNRLPQEDLALARHPERDCVYEEMEACARLGKADSAAMEFQRKAYLDMKFPAHAGLFKAGILLRRDTEKVAELNRAWWRYTLSFATWRDQLTLPLALWEMDWKPSTVDDSVLRPFFAQMAVHRKMKRK